MTAVVTIILLYGGGFVGWWEVWRKLGVGVEGKGGGVVICDAEKLLSAVGMG